MKTLAMSFLAAAATLLVSTNAKAETATAPFNPAADFRPTEFPWESGYIPDSGPLQVNIQATAYQDVLVEMFGDGGYDFDAEQITFTGEQDSGTFRNTLGADVTVTIAVDALGVNAEFDVGLYNIEEDALADFTPYVLPGADPRPIFVAEQIGPNNLVDTDFTVPGFDVPGHINIDYVIDIPGITYESHAIELTDDMDSAVAVPLGTYDVENSDLALTLPGAAPGVTSSVWGTLNGELDSEVAITFITTASVTIFDTPIEIGPIETQLDYPVVTDEPVPFMPLEMQYTTPEAPAGTSGGEEPETTGDGGSTGDGSSDGDPTTGAPPNDPTTGGDTDDSGTDSAGGGGADGGDGCGCSTDGSPNAGWLALGLVGLLGLRRRRD